ncbi:ATP-binding cassette sub-family A member 3-like isoform X5 [Dinothrombium tinctorium]|uniref:ATP-binding cassette sub-family A member 3-like isoform X5 n=1 Tax=Dinothrombium tinctorium TaxID=1965070 RepID=A0A443R678_9ACAR|nr:ATP-binding cassette sub-family A member 3-like isoform X5 [Dinothrombium tinctorium]
MAPLFVSRVSKDFYSRKSVLKDISFEVKENSLTALLGPNGSGKSTLINIITGLMDATKGKVFIKGKNMSEDKAEAQSHLGICPQYNPFFKYLTVREHLEMMCLLKCSLRERNDRVKVEEVLKLIDLENDAHQMTQLLSAGKLRRLTLAMAMIGPSDILVLDEPSQSLDPMAKKKVWDAILKARKTKTILVCSHHVKEINVIADSIAILINGELICMETSLGLKKKFGTGYRVKVKRNIDAATLNRTKESIVNHIADVVFEETSHDKEEIVFYSKFDDNKQLCALFKQLEKESLMLGINSIKVFATTIEDVYLKLTENIIEEQDVREWNFDKRNIANYSTKGNSSEVRRLFECFAALFLKNFKYTFRNYSIFYFLIMIPAILILCTMAVLKYITNHNTFLYYNKNIANDKIYGPYLKAFVESDDSIFVEEYKTGIRSSASDVLVYNKHNNQIQDWLLSLAKINLKNYFTKFLFGASLVQNYANNYNLTIWYNPTGTFVLPISLNLATTALINLISSVKHYSIEVESKLFTETQTLSGFNGSHCISLLLISGIIYFLIINFIDHPSSRFKMNQIFNLLVNSVRKESRENCSTSQENVLGEVEEERNMVEQLVKNNRISNEAVVIQNLTKSFDGMRRPNNLSFLVHKNECFGLLGGNGCGKTTTFRLLSSQLAPTSGNAYINDVLTSLTHNNRKYLSEIGYCPQNDALVGCFTGLETLILFMNLRERKNFQLVKRIVNKFYLQPVINHKISTYSIGNRRKLSLALALIGSPKLLLLDEPTCELDHNSSQKFWELLRNILDTFNVSILLTSHNLEEVESLCNRIAVMENGKLRCIGSLNELRKKFEHGFNVTLKIEREFALNEQHLNQVKSTIVNNFGQENVSLKCENLGVFNYTINPSSNRVSNLFEIMENIKEGCKVENYIISNATLENALLTLMGENLDV